ncbi:nucleoside hydrolase [Aquiluna sp. Uisw_065]|uniref:nucleoside hydrolase n=1 Tax=Aquiluna sp. Uisw_065 TaxID=3230967 RepID=UPI0039E80D73
MTVSIILDVDTGVDDAFAILYATRNPEIAVLGITCVDGNTSLNNVCKNTLQVLDMAGASKIPVAAGANEPLMGTAGDLGDASHVHGGDGLAGLSNAGSSRVLDSRHAIELIRDLIEGSKDPVTLVPIGPLTNIALFISTFPKTAKKLERIVLMGGSASGGNMTAAAEFNVWHDPEAAHIVFNSGLPVTMYGLDVFYDLKVDQTHVVALREAGSVSADFAADLIEFRLQSLGSEMCLGDYGAVASLLHPELVGSSVMNVVVDTSQGPGRGQTICDARPDAPELYGFRPGKECTVILKVDADAMVKLWMEQIK